MRRLSLGRLARREDGFTMIELLVALPMAAALIGALMFMVTSTSENGQRSQEQLGQQLEARAALGAFVGDLRQAYDCAGTGTTVIAATATQLVFCSPDSTPAPAGGALPPFHLREIAYQFANGQLQRQELTSTNTFPSAFTFPAGAFPSATAWSTVFGRADSRSTGTLDMTKSGFVYYDVNGGVLAQPVANLNLVRSVELDLTSTAGTVQGRVTSYSAQATIRAAQ